MNLEAMRECAKIRPFRIHQSRPLDDFTVPVVVDVDLDYDYRTHSTLCQIGPQAKHSRCQAQWCKCPCHTDYTS